MSGNMSRKLLSSFAALAVVLALTTFAPAAISEIYAGFPNHTGLLPPTPILTAPTANATYLIFVSLTAANGEPVLVHLTWNDPNGGLTGASYEEGYAMIMHVAAGTAPMVSTSCGDEGTCIFPTICLSPASACGREPRKRKADYRNPSGAMNLPSPASCPTKPCSPQRARELICSRWI
jgi:hypothetical protein